MLSQRGGSRQSVSGRRGRAAWPDLLIPAGREAWQVGIIVATLTQSQQQQQPCDPRGASHPVLCWVSLHALPLYAPAGGVLAGGVVGRLKLHPATAFLLGFGAAVNDPTPCIVTSFILKEKNAFVGFSLQG